MAQTTPFTQAELTDIRRFAGFAAFAAWGYIFSGDMATLDTQCAAMSNAEQAVVRLTYLAVLPGLESAVYAAGSNLDTDAASVWTHNKSEVADRTRLYNQCRREMCSFIGVRPGEGLRGAGQTVRT